MLYTVYIAIDRDRADEWLDWMRQVHVADVIDTGCFVDATLARDPDRDTDQRTAFRVVYRALSEEAFETYQSEHAPPLQQEHTLRYDGAFDASRDVLEIVETFD